MRWLARAGTAGALAGWLQSRAEQLPAELCTGTPLHAPASCGQGHQRQAAGVAQPVQGRCLCPALAPSSWPAAQVPNSNQQVTGQGYDVFFAVTLPQASQDSLVVTQPSSDAVHRQIAGWFTTQMQSRGALPGCCE